MFDLVFFFVFWFCGGDNNYMEGSVEYFKIRDFVFDLVVIVFVKFSIFFFVYFWFEYLLMK